MSKVTDPEPAPLDVEGVDVVDLVKEDLDERRRVGIATYGKPLRAGNGRRALRDMYAEDLDRIQYLRQEIAEREALADHLEAEAREALVLASVAGYEEEHVHRGRHAGLMYAACLVRGNHPQEES